MDFWRAIEILARRKWLILLSVVVATTLTFGATRLIGSKWVGSARFFSAPENRNLPTAEDPLQTSDRGPDMEVARQQADAYDQLVHESQVLEPALKDINLTIDDVPDLLENLKFVATSPRSFELQVGNSNPERSAKLANALAQSFADRYEHLFTQNAATTVKALQVELSHANRELKIANERFDAYRRQHALVGPFEENLRPLMNRLLTARQKRDDANSRLAEARARLDVAVRDLSGLQRTVPREKPLEPSAVISALEAERARAESDLARLEGKYTPSHPEVMQAREIRDSIVKRLAKEMRSVPKTMSEEPNPARIPLEQTVRDLRQEIQGNEASAIQLDRDIGILQGQIQSFSGVDGALAALSAEVAQRTEERYHVSTRLQVAKQELNSTSGRNPLRISDLVGPLNPPINSTEGRTKKLILLAALCSLVGSAGLIVAFDSVDRRLRTVQEADLALPSRVLAAIPQPLGPVTAASLPRAAELFPLSMHSEAYRFLAVRLLAAREQGVRSVMLASAKADQGSTATLSNLAITLAQAGQRVIVVDANLRTPAVHEVFGMTNNCGFSTLLRRPDAATLEQALQPTTVPNLRVITSGPDNANPWELFRSENLREVARRLEDLADYVLYDTPSALAFTDALSLAPAVDAALLCVRALEPTSGAEQRLVDMLEGVNVTVLGSVLSDVPASVLDSYTNYQRYYPAEQNGGGNKPALTATALPAGQDGARGIGNGTAPKEPSAWMDLPPAPTGRSEGRSSGIELDI